MSRKMESRRVGVQSFKRYSYSFRRYPTCNSHVRTKQAKSTVSLTIV